MRPQLELLVQPSRNSAGAEMKGAEEVGFEPTTRDTESMGVYQRLLCAQKPHWMSTKVAYYLSLSIGSAVSFAVRYDRRNVVCEPVFHLYR